MEAAQTAKRRRLSAACHECRRRKVKCDAQYPRCRNCVLRNANCTATNPKHHGLPVIREWVEDKVAPQEPPEANESTNQSDEYTQTPSVTLGQTQHAEINISGEVEKVSPVYQPYQMSFYADHGSTNRIKMMGGSSSTCLVKSLDLYLEAANVRAVSPSFQYGMRHAEEHDLPLVISLPPFPTMDIRLSYIDTYFKQIHVLWPILYVDETKNAIQSLASVENLNSLSRDQISPLASAYLILSMGADEKAQDPTADGEKYLQAAASLLGFVVQVPYLPAVQTLLLLAIAYRGRNKDGLAWQMIGMAIRIGQTLGLHKHSALRPSKEHVVTQRGDQLYHARIWAVCCCLEKMLQLESGRPSAILNVDRDQMMGQFQKAPGHDFLQWNMGLAEYQSQISQHMYSYRPRDRTAKSILQDTARLDGALQTWKSDMPVEFQPGSELFCSNEDLHVAAFLSIQWHQTMIALHRAALIAPGGSFDAEVEQYCVDDSSKHRIKRGEVICVNSARAIIRLSLDLQERQLQSRLLTMSPPLLACAALSIFLMKHPGGRAQGADLELLKAAVEYTADHCVKSGQDRRLAQGILSIHSKVRLYFRQKQSVQRRNEPENTSDSLQYDSSNPKPGDRTPTGAGTYSSRTGTNVYNSILPNPKMPSYQNSNNSAPVSQAFNHQLQGASIGEPLIQAPNTNSAVLNGREWTPVSQEQNFLFSTNEDPFDSLLINQEMPLSMERTPFNQCSVEELYDWMFLVDSTNDSQDTFDASGSLPL